MTPSTKHLASGRPCPGPLCRGEEQPLTAFPPFPAAPGGIAPWCKPCIRHAAQNDLPLWPEQTQPNPTKPNQETPTMPTTHTCSRRDCHHVGPPADFLPSSLRPGSRPLCRACKRKLNERIRKPAASSSRVTTARRPPASTPQRPEAPAQAAPPPPTSGKSLPCAKSIDPSFALIIPPKDLQVILDFVVNGPSKANTNTVRRHLAIQLIGKLTNALTDI